MDGDEGGGKRVVKLYVGIAIIAAVGLSSIFAASISITKPHSVTEFSQGVYKIKACDSFIRMNLISGETGVLGAPAGLSPLTGISIVSLNPHACKNTTFTIDAYDSSSIQTPLYRTDGQVALCSDSACTPGANSQNDVVVNIDGVGNVALASPDEFHAISYDSKTAIYRITFAQPTVLANDVGSLTIQSGPLNQ
jgi:hypothetical protein